MTVAPLGVSRPISVEAVNRALAGDRMVLLLLQKGDVDEPSPDDLHRVGTVAIIRQMAKTPMARGCGYWSKASRARAPSSCRTNAAC